MSELEKSGQLLHRLDVGKSMFKTYAICLLNYKILANIIHDPEYMMGATWTSTFK